MNFNPFTSISSHQPTRHPRLLTSCTRRSETLCHDGEVRPRVEKLEVSLFPGVVWTTWSKSTEMSQHTSSTTPKDSNPPGAVRLFFPDDDPHIHNGQC